MKRDQAGAYLARLAGVVTLALTGVIATWADPDAWFILILPAFAGVLAIARASSRGMVGIDAVVLLLGAVPLILGGAGFLYLPPVGMLALAAFFTTKATVMTQRRATG